MNPTSPCDLPSVPKQAGTFIRRLVNKFFSITSTSQKLFARSSENQTHLSSMKPTRILSTESHSDWKMTSKSRRARRKQRRSNIRTNNNNYQACTAYRPYRNCLSNPPHSSPADSLEHVSNSPPAMNKNRQTTDRSMTFCKQRSLNEVQRENLGSAIEQIFDTLISTYTNASFPA
jgi:hypothetical protein